MFVVLRFSQRPSPNAQINLFATKASSTLQYIDRVKRTVWINECVYFEMLILKFTSFENGCRCLFFHRIPTSAGAIRSISRKKIESISTSSFFFCSSECRIKSRDVPRRKRIYVNFLGGCGMRISWNFIYIPIDNRQTGCCCRRRHITFDFKTPFYTVLNSSLVFTMPRGSIGIFA